MFRFENIICESDRMSKEAFYPVMHEMWLTFLKSLTYITLSIDICWIRSCTFLSILVKHFKLFDDYKLECFVITENFNLLREFVQLFYLIWHFDCERWHNHQIFLVDFAGLLVVDQVDDGNVRLTGVVPRWRGHRRRRVGRVSVRVQTERHVTEVFLTKLCNLFYWYSLKDGRYKYKNNPRTVPSFFESS